MNCRASPCGIVLLNYSDLRCLYRRAMFLQIDRFISAHPLFYVRNVLHTYEYHQENIHKYTSHLFR